MSHAQFVNWMLAGQPLADRQRVIDRGPFLVEPAGPHADQGEVVIGPPQPRR
jgi:hypothetical protein